MKSVTVAQWISMVFRTVRTKLTHATLLFFISDVSVTSKVNVIITSLMACQWACNLVGHQYCVNYHR